VEIDEIERRIMQLEIERQALPERERCTFKERRKQIEKELAVLKEDSSGRKARWQAEKEAIGKSASSRSRSNNFKAEEQKYERAGELAKVAEIRYGKIAAAERDLKQAQERFSAVQKDAPMLKEEVDERRHREAREQMDRNSHGPIAGRRSAEAVHMEERLRQRVVGQDDALGRISNAVRRSRAGSPTSSGDRLVHFSRSYGRRKKRNWLERWRSFSSTTKN